MTLRLDHLVILVPQLDAAIDRYRACGFTVLPGGTHAEGATHNALVVFADGAYLELIAFLKPAPEHRWGTLAARGHQGFIDMALLPDSVGTVVAAAAARGLAYTGPLPGGRLRPDGQRLEWQIGTPPTADLPFLCGDLTPRALRVPEEGGARQHANGATGVAALTVAVDDLATSLARWRALLGDAALQAPPAALPGLGLCSARLQLGSASLVLVAPQGPADGAAATQAQAALQAALGGRSAGVIGLALQAPAPRALPLAETLGAPIQLVGAA